MKLQQITETKYDPSFKELDGTNPVKPYTQSEILKAMLQLHARVERQAANYGGDPHKHVDPKTGKVDTSKHKYFDAQIAPNE